MLTQTTGRPTIYGAFAVQGIREVHILVLVQHVKLLNVLAIGIGEVLTGKFWCVGIVYVFF